MLACATGGPTEAWGPRQQVLVAGEWASLGLDPRPLLTRPPHKPHFPSFGPSNGGPDGLVEMMIVVVLRIFCLRFGTEPRFLEDESVSAVRLSSRILSCGGAGGGSMGSGVGEATMSGPKMVLKPFPAKSPLNAAGSPSGGVVEGVLVWCGSGRSSPKRKSLGELNRRA
jgi:hypothetical protein